MDLTMIQLIMRLAVAVGAGSALMLSAPSACAQLGGTVSAKPRAASEAISNNLADASIRIRAWTDEGGTTIHEYATGDGLIFAYTWEGPTMPDLARLLGQY